MNFARFDAKLEQRIVELRAEVQMGFARLDAKLEQRIAEPRADWRTEFATGLTALEARLSADSSASGSPGRPRRPGWYSAS